MTHTEILKYLKDLRQKHNTDILLLTFLDNIERLIYESSDSHFLEDQIKELEVENEYLREENEALLTELNQ